jgi:hypothetical protein
MIYLVGILWCASLIGVCASIIANHWIGAGTMMMNLVLATIMIVERLDQ